MWCAPVLLVLCLLFGASFQCRQMVSVEGYSLIGHAVTSVQVPSLQECMWECSGMEWCKSLTYNYANRSCDLSNVTNQQHPEDYVAKEGFVYWGGFHILSSCAEIKEKYPDSKSGDHTIMLGDREVQVYCDMENHGGGWTLVVTIDKDSKKHLERQQYCSKPTFCVPFKDLSDNQVLHKFKDEDIQHLANREERILYGYTTPGIYLNRAGLLYVK